MEFRNDLLDKLNGGGALREKEILCIILSNAFGGKDMTEVADKLLSCFPGIYAVFSAEYAELVSCGIPKTVASYLRIVGSVHNFEKVSGVTIKDTKAFVEFAKGRFVERDVEYIELYLVDRNYVLMGIVSYTSNRVNTVYLPMPRAVRDVAPYSAYAMYIAHNHVNCSTRPSRADDRVTKKIEGVCKRANLKFLDHCIINTDGEYFSYLENDRLNL